MDYRYKLSNKPKLTCPGCGRPKRFCAYVDTETGQPIDAAVAGKCDRIYNCGYHVTPSEYFKNHGYKTHCYKPKTNLLLKQMEETYENYVPEPQGMKASLSYRMGQNPLFRFFYSLLPEKFFETEIRNVFHTYGVGTSKKWDYSTLFWLKDKDGTVTDGKIMGFDPETGRRRKEPVSQITWTSSIVAKEQKKKFFPTKKPFFGEHLLRSNKSGVVLVFESEKTALLCALILQNFFDEKFYRGITPIATSGSHGLGRERLDTLKSWLYENGAPILNTRRAVVFFPDNGMYDEWKKTLDEYLGESLARDYVFVSRLMETDKIDRYEIQVGDDFGDFFVDSFRRYPAYSFMNCYLTIINELNALNAYGTK